MISGSNKERERNYLQKYYALLSEKLHNLRMALAIEVDPAVRFKLEQQIQQIEMEREKTNQEIETIEEKLGNIEKGEDFINFWNVFLGEIIPKERIYAVLSTKGTGVDFQDRKPINVPGHTIKLSYNEVEPLFELQKKLYLRVANLQVVHGGIELNQDEKLITISSEFPKDGKLIIIGSPHANRICSEIMSVPNLNMPYLFGLNKDSETCHKCIKTKHGMFPSTDKEAQELSIDFGIISRIKNPWAGATKNKVLILAGNHGFATESAVRFVADEKLIKILHEKVEGNDFEALFEAHTDKIRGFTLDFLEIAIFRNNEWQLVYQQ